MLALCLDLQATNQQMFAMGRDPETMGRDPETMGHDHETMDLQSTSLQQRMAG